MGYYTLGELLTLFYATADVHAGGGGCVMMVRGVLAWEEVSERRAEERRITAILPPSYS